MSDEQTTAGPDEGAAEVATDEQGAAMDPCPFESSDKPGDLSDVLVSGRIKGVTRRCELVHKQLGALLSCIDEDTIDQCDRLIGAYINVLVAARRLAKPKAAGPYRPGRMARLETKLDQALASLARDEGGAA